MLDCGWWGVSQLYTATLQCCMHLLHAAYMKHSPLGLFTEAVRITGAGAEDKLLIEYHPVIIEGDVC